MAGFFRKVLWAECTGDQDAQCPKFVNKERLPAYKAKCSDCGSKAREVTQLDSLKFGTVAGILLLLIAVGSLWAVGMAGNHLSAAETMRWAFQKIHLQEHLEYQNQGRRFFSGHIILAGANPGALSDFLCSEVQGEKRCLWRYPSRDGDGIHFEFSAQVPYAYVLHRGGSESVFVLPRHGDVTKVPEGGQVRAPSTENIRLVGGPGIEHFVLIFGTEKVSELEDQLKASSFPTELLDHLTAQLAKDPRYAVLHVEVPHT